MHHSKKQNNPHPSKKTLCIDWTHNDHLFQQFYAKQIFHIDESSSSSVSEQPMLQCYKRNQMIYMRWCWNLPGISCSAPTPGMEGWKMDQRWTRQRFKGISTQNPLQACLWFMVIGSTSPASRLFAAPQLHLCAALQTALWSVPLILNSKLFTVQFFIAQECWTADEPQVHNQAFQSYSYTRLITITHL